MVSILCMLESSLRFVVAMGSQCEVGCGKDKSGWNIWLWSGSGFVKFKSLVVEQIPTHSQVQVQVQPTNPTTELVEKNHATSSFPARHTTVIPHRLTYTLLTTTMNQD